jgi:hypothetical protein
MALLYVNNPIGQENLEQKSTKERGVAWTGQVIGTPPLTIHEKS